MAVKATARATFYKREKGNYTFLRYSNDGGQTFTEASQSAIDEARGSLPLEGRNLLKGTRDFSPNYWYGDLSTVAVSTLDASVSMINVISGFDPNPSSLMSAQGWNFIIGETYTVSVYARTDLEGVTLGVTAQTIATNPKQLSAKWKLLTWTFVATNGSLIRFRFETNGPVAQITKPKIEKGNNATSWTPAPEDCTFGTTEGEYMGTLVWDKPYPSNDPKDYTWGKVKGNDGKGIASVTEYYQVSNSPTTAPTSWSNTPPATTATNRYLWNYEVITYTDGTSTETQKRVIGVYGDTGKGISGVTNNYLATTAGSGVTTSTAGWTTAVQAVTATNRYLWNYEVISYTDGTSTTVAPHIIGVWGDTGTKGADAEAWTMSPITETALVDKDDKLVVTLKYGIYHTVGDTRESVNSSADGYTIKYRGSNGVPGTTTMSTGATPTATYTLQHYSTASNKPQYMIVELYNGSTVVDVRTVPVTLKAESWIELDKTRAQLITQNAQQINSIGTTANNVQATVTALRNGVRNLTRGRFNTTWSTAGAFQTDYTRVTLEQNTTYTLTMCGELAPELASQGIFIQLSLSNSDNAFNVRLNLTGAGKKKVYTTFTTAQSGFPSNGAVAYMVYLSGSYGGYSATLYWVTITPGTIPAEDYYEDTQMMIEDGRVIINGETHIESMLFADKAKVGGGVFFDRYMYSASGSGTKAGETDAYQYFNKNSPYNDTSWRPKMVFDWATGEAVFCDGKVHLYPDGSGYLAGGNVSWDANNMLNVAGVVRANAIYSRQLHISQAATLISGGYYYDIDPVNKPATTIELSMPSGVTARLPRAYDYGGLEITMLFYPDIAQYAVLTPIGSDVISLFNDRGNTALQSYEWASRISFSRMEGYGWAKLFAVRRASNTSYWLITGFGGVLQCTSGSTIYWLKNGNTVLTN